MQAEKFEAESLIAVGKTGYSSSTHHNRSGGKKCCPEGNKEKGREGLGLQHQVGWSVIMRMTATPINWIPKDLAQSWR